MNPRNSVLLLGVLLLAAGCDLEEAQRLDLTRASSRILEPRFDGVALDGSTDLPLTRTLGSLWSPDGARRWSLAWTDLADGQSLPLSWRVVGTLDGIEVLAVEGQGLEAHSLQAAPPETWIDCAGQVLMRLDSLSVVENSWIPWIPVLPQRIRDDRPDLRLERTFSFAAGEVRRRGDTLFAAVHNPGVNAIVVYSDYTGVRQIGAYELLVPPGGRDTLRWLVTDDPSGDRWIDLGWGDWGAHERRSFLVP